MLSMIESTHFFILLRLLYLNTARIDWDARSVKIHSEINSFHRRLLLTFVERSGRAYQLSPEEAPAS